MHYYIPLYVLNQRNQDSEVRQCEKRGNSLHHYITYCVQFFSYRGQQLNCY